MANKFSSKWIKVSEPHPHVYHVELCRGPVNAFNAEYWSEYGNLFRRLSEEGSDIRAVVLSSALPKIFTVGIDLQDIGLLLEPNAGDTARFTFALRQWLTEFQTAIGAPERCPFPVIAACHGHVIGLGVDIVSACDIRYTASDASFSIKEVDVGLAPDIGSLAYLPKVTGNQSLVRELTYTARNFGVSEAEKLGLVSKVVQGGREQVVTAALDLARLIASKSPIAVANSKFLISHSRDHTVEDNLRYTAAWNASQLMTEDIKENLRSAKAKTPPKFKALPAKL